MLIAVDVGNTQIVVGAFADESLHRSWRLSTHRSMTADEFEVLLRGMLGEFGGAAADCIVSSVVPPLTDEIAHALRELTGRVPLVVAPGVKTGMPIRTDNPQEVGADRIINAVAAHEKYGAPLVVIDFGTATTLDVVNQNGEYAGGVICPGPQLGAEALAARAARLPRVELSVPDHVIGRNTVDSLRAGLMYGHAAMVNGLVSRIERELDVPIRVVATGGLSRTFGPLLDSLDVTDENLTLEGLRLVFSRNRPS